MRARLAALLLAAGPAWACEGPVCQVDPQSLALTQLIDFEGLGGVMGPGKPVPDVLALPGARFGKHFAGQRLGQAGNFDTVTGAATAPLTLLAGPKRQTKSLVYVSGNTILNGFGADLFPSRTAQGEGALAIQFDTPQPALAFDIRGGEAGTATLHFLAPTGATIARLTLGGIGEGPVAFVRGGGQSDISGLVITNEDPQGIAIDNVRFGQPLELG